MTKSNAGTYVFDAKSGKVVKTSDRIPKVASKGKPSPSSSKTGPCGRTQCGGGRCAGL